MNRRSLFAAIAGFFTAPVAAAYASGGVVRGGYLGTIGDGGCEAVVPLKRGIAPAGLERIRGVRGDPGFELTSRLFFRDRKNIRVCVNGVEIEGDFAEIDTIDGFVRVYKRGACGQRFVENTDEWVTTLHGFVEVTIVDLEYVYVPPAL